MNIPIYKNTNFLSKTLLVLAISILLLLTAVSYKQISAFKKSADFVTNNLLIDKEINNLFFHYSFMESKGLRAVILNDSTYIPSYKNYEIESNNSLKKLYALTQNIDEFQPHLDTIKVLKNQFFVALSVLNQRLLNQEISNEIVMTNVIKADKVAEQLNNYKVKMVQMKENLYREKMAVYQKERVFTPFLSFVTSLFALLIFILAFVKINKDRKLALHTQNFQSNIFASVSDAIVVFEAVRDRKANIIDFKVIFLNDESHVALGKNYKDKLGKSASVVFPEIFDSKTFDKMVHCIDTNQQVEYETIRIKEDKTFYYCVNAMKLDDGVTLTIYDITDEKEIANELLQKNEQLVIQNSILAEAKNMAKIGSYTWDLETGVAKISDNYYRLLGYEPNEFEVNQEKYLELIHPDDREKMKKRALNALEKNKISETTYRILTKNGRVKYFKSRGKYIDKSGKTILIGVVQDVTKQAKNEQKLKNKNLALKRSNTELESFNRVVSHDLQEPLRKVQMFISRMEDTHKLSEKSRSYLEKIKDASNRMQSLIKNLLTYSRIDSVGGDFVLVDLQTVVEKTIHDFSNEVEEYHITITYDNLPILKGVLFQMEQLFTNLFSNTIKYRSKNVTPVIIIEATKIHRNQITQNFLKNFTQYHKITFTDNGIGFDQENADDVFEIFKRLHQKHEYSGTGIGLAICKKIIENHKGTIFATSQLGVGTTFTIYLPA